MSFVDEVNDAAQWVGEQGITLEVPPEVLSDDQAMGVLRLLFEDHGVQLDNHVVDTNSIAEAGRYGDTEIAHVTPEEQDILKAMGGAGTVNPATGLREFRRSGPPGRGPSAGGPGVGDGGPGDRGQSGPKGRSGVGNSPGTSTGKGATSGSGETAARSFDRKARRTSESVSEGSFGRRDIGNNANRQRQRIGAPLSTKNLRAKAEANVALNRQLNEELGLNEPRIGLPAPPDEASLFGPNFRTPGFNPGISGSNPDDPSAPDGFGGLSGPDPTQGAGSILAAFSDAPAINQGQSRQEPFRIPDPISAPGFLRLPAGMTPLQERSYIATHAQNSEDSTYRDPETFDYYRNLTMRTLGQDADYDDFLPVERSYVASRGVRHEPNARSLLEALFRFS